MKFKLYIVLFLISSTLFAQKVTTSVDSVRNKIGAEFQLTLKTSVDKKTKVKFPEAKNFGVLEVIESYKIDTIKNNDSYELVKKYGLTQFDSGKYVIPQLKVLINGKPVLSDSIKVEVANVKVDTLKQKMYDIKGIEKEKSDSNLWKYIVAILVVLALAVLGFFLYKKFKKGTKEEELIFKSPIEKATSLLQSLEKKELWQHGEVKEYYSELTDIVRTYIEEEIQIPAMESTTSELIVSLKKVASQKKMKLTSETLKNLEKVLKQADLVKFAKVKPLDFEIEEDKKRITSAVVKIHDSIPVIVEEKDELTEYNERQLETLRLKKLAERKKKRIISGILIFFGVLFASVLITIGIKGFDYVKDLVLGNPTKELAQGEWIFSDYGNPAIRIETPKVLKRIDAEKTLPKDAMALIKEMQLFSYGNLSGDFFISIATKKLKQPTEINLDQLANETVNVMESQGGSNIILKQEDYKTNKGITGKKAYGTLTILDKLTKTSKKLYYEIVFFKQDGGIQQVTIAYPEGDKYGIEVAARIINSVELQNTQE